MRAPIRHFVIMARTDALASEGLEAAIDRAQAYVRRRRRHDLRRSHHRRSTSTAIPPAPSGVPVLANITEFGKTPLFTRDELARRRRATSSSICCSAYRAMNAAALKVYQAIRTRRHAEATCSTHADARRALRLSRLPRLRSKSSTSCSAEQGRTTGTRASDARSMSKRAALLRPFQTQEIRRAFRRRRPATPRSAPSATAATICTIAATTSSTSPRNASSKKSPIS